MDNNRAKLYSIEKYNETKKIWEKFKDDIKYNNRFFQDNSVVKILDRLKDKDDTNRTKDDSYMVGLLCEGMNFFRARIGNFKEKDDSEILAPPKNVVKQGRCNSEGISYLYAAHNWETAIYEVKPSKGDIVTVAKIKLGYKHLFSFKTQQEIHKHLRSNPIKDPDIEALIDIINDELSKVVTSSNILDYIPFQFITEYIKKRGYDGFIYKSTLNNGTNYVFFETDSVEVLDKSLYKIDNLKLEIEKLV